MAKDSELLTTHYSPPTEENWFSSADEGQLSVDVYRDGNDLVIRSTVAGVAPENLSIAIHDDLLTIRGEREGQREVNEDDWFYEECYWGSFSRSIVLPMDVYPERTQASLKNGVLEIRLPIRSHDYRLNIRAVES